MASSPSYSAAISAKIAVRVGVAGIGGDRLREHLPSAVDGLGDDRLVGRLPPAKSSSQAL